MKSPRFQWLVRRLHRGLKATGYLRWRSWDRALGIFVDPSAHVHRKALLDTGVGGRIVVGARTDVHRGAILATMGRDIVIGADSSVNPYSIIYGGATIGRGVRIAANTVIVPMNHVFDDPSSPIMEQGVERRGITIEDDVWIGSGVTILDGVTIVSGCVIAAGAVLSRSTPVAGVYGGVPAKLIRARS